MMEKYILDDEGNPIPCDDLYEWGRWFETAMREGRKHLKQETVGNYWISTVFLGMNHRHFSDGPPLLWETMICNRVDDDIKSRWLDYQDRYSTKEEALAGHEAAKKWLFEKFPELVQ